MNEQNQTNFIIDRDKNNTELSAQNITSSLSYELNQHEGSQNNGNFSLSNISQLNFNDSSEKNLHQEQKLLNDIKKVKIKNKNARKKELRLLRRKEKKKARWASESNSPQSDPMQTEQLSKKKNSPP